MDAAIAETARRLRAVIDEHGPDAFAFYVSGQMSLEAQYLANKLAKGFVRTNQIESNSRLCMASAGTGYKLSLGADGPPGSYQDFEHADVFFVIGSNMADCHPILFLRMMDRVKSGGAKLIVVDPRRSATADKADLFLPVRPGTDLALLNGLLHLLHENGHTDPEFIAAHTEGWEAIPEFLADYPPATVADITGVPEADIREAARLIGEAGEWMSCWTMGLNQSTHGTWNTNALVNLHLATGAICRPGSGPFSLTGQPNAMGGREMGYMGPGLPGQRSVLVAAERAFVEELWELPPGTVREDGVGRGTVEMFRKMADGDIKACWIICTNPVASVANRRTVIEGLERAEFVVAQDVFAETETNAYADVVLPGALWTETEGVLVNSERNVTLARPAVEPPGRRWRTGGSSPLSPARWDTSGASRTTARKRSSRRSSAPAIRRPGTTFGVSPTTGCGPRRCSGPPRARTAPTAIRSGMWARTAAGRSSPRRAAGRCSTPVRTSLPPRCRTTTIRTS